MRIFGSVFYARLFQRKMTNAREFSRYWIGAELLRRSGLESYMRRFYGIALDQIDIDLAKKRMLWISEHASLGNLARRLLGPRRGGQPINSLRARKPDLRLFTGSPNRTWKNEACNSRSASSRSLSIA